MSDFQTKKVSEFPESKNSRGFYVYGVQDGQDYQYNLGNLSNLNLTPKVIFKQRHQTGDTNIKVIPGEDWFLPEVLALNPVLCLVSPKVQGRTESQEKHTERSKKKKWSMKNRFEGTEYKINNSVVYLNPMVSTGLDLFKYPISNKEFFLQHSDGRTASNKTILQPITTTCNGDYWFPRKGIKRAVGRRDGQIRLHLGLSVRLINPEYLKAGGIIKIEQRQCYYMNVPQYIYCEPFEFYGILAAVTGRVSWGFGL